MRASQKYPARAHNGVCRRHRCSLKTKDITRPPKSGYSPETKPRMPEFRGIRNGAILDLPRDGAGSIMATAQPITLPLGILLVRFE